MTTDPPNLPDADSDQRLTAEEYDNNYQVTENHLYEDVWGNQKDPSKGVEWMTRRIEYLQMRIKESLDFALTQEQEAVDTILGAVAKDKQDLKDAEERLAFYQAQLKGRN